MDEADKYLIQTVSEDLVHISKSWSQTVDDATLRRESVILRRLLVDDDLHKAWRSSGLSGGPYIIAPRVEYFLEHKDCSLIQYLIAGGGLYGGLVIALALDNVGSKPIELSMKLNPAEHKFKLKEFLASTSIYVEHTRISRQGLIQYVANKLGGAHIDSSRKDKQARIHRILDQNINRFLIQVEGLPPIQDKNTIYFELLSIGQLVAKSPDIGRFLSWARELLGGQSIS